MKGERIEVLHTRLVRLREQVLAQMRESVGLPVELPPPARAVELARERRLHWHMNEGLIQRVDSALARIRDGTYGQCIHCGGVLELELLEAVPESALCPTCRPFLRLPCSTPRGGPALTGAGCCWR